MNQVQNLKTTMKNEIIKYQLPLEAISINTIPEVNTDENDSGQWLENGVQKHYLKQIMKIMI